MDKINIFTAILSLFALCILSRTYCSGATNNEKTIKCYNCTSDYLRNGDSDACIMGNKDKMPVADCKGEKMACVKVYTKLYVISKGSSTWDKAPTVVSRFCDTPGDFSIGCSTHDANKGEQKLCFCSGEKCNGAQYLSASFGILLLAGLLSILMF